MNERLTELVEHGNILTQAQGGFRQDKSTDMNACKVYNLTREGMSFVMARMSEEKAMTGETEEQSKGEYEFDGEMVKKAPFSLPEPWFRMERARCS